ncbi:MAG TPA: MmcQ/YjbR family DNA-binding protein [Nocardioidaceae bacterium]|nr:MmcQ/YjbR family DNA-binding protein [Nocardioidaceae bacterium]
MTPRDAGRRPTRRRARPADLAEIATSLPGVSQVEAWGGRPAFSVGKRLFAGHRSPRPDALDPATGERLTDVIIIWTPDEQDKIALAEGDGPWFTTPHFNGYAAVLVRESELGSLRYNELAEVITDAWRTRAPKRLVAQWEASRLG